MLFCEQALQGYTSVMPEHIILTRMGMASAAMCSSLMIAPKACAAAACTEWSTFSASSRVVRVVRAPASTTSSKYSASKARLCKHLAAAACKAGKPKDRERTRGLIPPASTIFFCSWAARTGQHHALGSLVQILYSNRLHKRAAFLALKALTAFFATESQALRVLGIKSSCIIPVIA